MNSVSSESSVVPLPAAHIGLIVSEDIERPYVPQRENVNTTANTDTIFSLMVDRISRTRWFLFIRRVFHYQNARPGSDIRSNPLNSRAWICFEAFMAVSQIVAAAVILGVSHNERPVSPLRLWVSGYTLGCFLSLPVLYWRYRHLYVDSDGSAVETARGHDNNSRRSGQLPSSMGVNIESSSSRMAFFMERCRMSLDFFFAVWFVIGNVWVFGTRRPFAEDAPVLHRLCIALLALSCVGYALPFILFAILCCCMPCISAMFGHSMASGAKLRGATSADIAALPTHSFKTLYPQHVHNKDGDLDSDSGNDRQAGYIIDAKAGRKRRVPANLSECCICLSKYKDGETLKELPCSHLFHSDCVDQWLKINSTCPLCKRELSGSKSMAYELEDMSRRVMNLGHFAAS